MALEPLSISVCSWSLQVTSIPELRRLLDRLGINVVQIACGDPHHAAWEEGDRLPEVARAAGFTLTGAMLGFPGEDYATPQTIQRTGGFGDPATRPARLDRRPRHATGADRAAPLGRGPDGGAGPDGPHVPRRLHPAARQPRPQAVSRYPGQGGRPGPGEGGHGGVRDGAGDGRPVAADARRAE